MIAREYVVLSIRFNTCPPYSKAESEITRDFEAQCSMFTYTTSLDIMNYFMSLYLTKYSGENGQ